MELPPMSKSKYFVVMVEELYSMSHTSVLPTIFDSYDEAQHNRVSVKYPVTDSFLRDFDSKEQAQKWINSHTKWEVA